MRRTDEGELKKRGWDAFIAEFDDLFGTKFAREQYEKYGFGRPGTYTIDYASRAIIDLTRRKPPLRFIAWFRKWKRENK